MHAWSIPGTIEGPSGVGFGVRRFGIWILRGNDVFRVERVVLESLMFNQLLDTERLEFEYMIAAIDERFDKFDEGNNRDDS